MKTRNKKFRRSSPAFVWIAAAFAFSARAGIETPAQDTTIYLVRHAEKQAAPPGDPPLTEAGLTRAANLALVLKPLGIKTIFTSPFLRTRETARPLAEAVGATPIVVDMISDRSAPGGIAERSIKELVERILDHRGEAILVVGHSNTLPLIIQGLGGGPVPSIPETEYDNLFILTISGKDEVSLVRRKYASGLDIINLS
jgi:broad specificity phosphatase PhoE